MSSACCPRPPHLAQGHASQRCIHSQQAPTEQPALTSLEICLLFSPSSGSSVPLEHSFCSSLGGSLTASPQLSHLTSPTSIILEPLWWPHSYSNIPGIFPPLGLCTGCSLFPLAPSSPAHAYGLHLSFFQSLPIGEPWLPTLIAAPSRLYLCLTEVSALLTRYSINAE